MFQRDLRRRYFIKLGSTVLLGALLGCSRVPESTGAANATSGSTSSSGQGAGDQPVRVGYLPITDAAPLLIADANKFYQDEGLTVEQPRLFRSWAQIVEAFQARQVNVIHLLMPAALWVRYSRQFPARVVAWNHVDGSALTVHAGVSSLADLGGQTVAVPFWYSIHNVVVQMLLNKAGLEPLVGGEEGKVGPNQVRLVTMAPSDMPPALAAGQIGGFIVAEPFNALSELQQKGRIFRFTGDVWKEHACCVALLHEDDLARRPAWSQAVVNALVRAQAWIRTNREQSAQMLSKDGAGKYTPHSEEVLRRVFTYYDPAVYGKDGAIQHPEWGAHRIDFQPYPYRSYTEALVNHLKETRVEGDTGFLASLDPGRVADDLVEYEFVKKAVAKVGGPSVFAQPAEWQRDEIISI